jgi:hypothetical protein
MEDELKKKISPNEKILWEGKPDKKCFMRKIIFSDILVGAIICAIVSCVMIYGLIKANDTDAVQQNNTGIIFVILVFSSFVWIYLGKIIFGLMRLRRIYYIVTNKGIYSLDGALFERIDFISFYEITDLGINQNRPNIADVWIGVQQSMPTPEKPVVVRRPDIAPGIQFEIASISDYKEVSEIIKQQCWEVRNGGTNSEGNNGYKTMSETTGRKID